MNIGIIKRKYLAEGGGGAEKYARFIVNGLIERGHKIFIFAKQFEAEESENLIHIPVKMNKLTSSSGTTAFHKGVQHILKKSVMEYNIDLTYALSRTYPVDIFRVTEQVHIEWLNLFYSSIQKFNPRHRGILNLEKNIFNPLNTKAVVSNSELVKTLIKKHYNYPNDKIHVIKNGLDKDNFDLNFDAGQKISLREKLLKNKDVNKYILFFIATNFKIKGLDSAIKAIAQLPTEIRTKTLLIVAGGDNPDKYQNLTNKLGISDNILFLGACKNAKDYYKLSDLLIYPSLGEPFGNVCLEAAACGLPVITTKQNGSSEIINENKNGYLINNANCIKKLSQYIEEFYNLPKTKKQEFYLNAIESAKKYDWHEHLNILSDLIQKIAK